MNAGPQQIYLQGWKHSLDSCTPWRACISAGVLPTHFPNRELDKKVFYFHRSGVKYLMYFLIPQDFTHPAIDGRVYDWDIVHFLSIRDNFGVLGDADKKHLAEAVYTEVENKLVPRLRYLKHSTIHGDCNEQNILVDPSTGRVCGIVDFGDCVRTCCVFELAILLAYCLLLVDTDGIQKVAPVVAGYLSVFPLDQDELDVLYYAVLARLCKSVVTGYLTFLQDPSNSYVLTTQKAGWTTIETLLRAPKHEVDEVWFRRLNVHDPQQH